MPVLRFLRRFELPLLKRELIESAQRRRTYALRVLLLLILGLIFTVFYLELSSRRSNPVRMLGTGRELALAVVITDLVAIYALLPAMACGAIASERERQTLPLLLISRLSYSVIILEKFISRMIPMLALLVISAPILAVTYVMGGVTRTDLTLLILILTTAAIQAASTAIFCSSLYATAMSAFWTSYALLAAMALMPPLLTELDLLPDVRWIKSLPGDQQAVPFTMFMLMIDRMWWSAPSLVDAALACSPVWVVAAAALVGSRVALARIGSGRGLTSRWLLVTISGLRSVIRRTLRTAPRLFARLREKLRRLKLPGGAAWARHSETVVAGQSDGAAALAVPDTQPIAWRETRSSLLLSWELHAIFAVALLLTEVWLLEDVFNSRWDREAVSVFVNATVLILGLLVMVSRSCHMFAAERERQTLDSLLTVPCTNRELLREKQTAANRLLVFWLVPVTLTLVLHLSYVQLSDRQTFPSWRRTELIWFSGPWWPKAGVIAVSVWAHTLVYLSIARWTGILFGLLFRSQMKAMIGALISLLAVTFVPLFLTMMVLLASDLDPDGFPLFFFSSPIIIYGSALVSELSMAFGQAGWFFRSELLVVLVNLAVYGTLGLVLRWQVLRRLPRLLSRLDEPPAAAREPVAPRSSQPLPSVAG